MPAIVATNDLGYYSAAVTVAEVPGIITAVLTRQRTGREVAGGIHRQSVLRSILLGGFAQVALTIVILVLPHAVPIVFGGILRLLWH